MKKLILLAACALSCSAATNTKSLTAEAIALHCQVEVLQPLTVHPELATAADLLDALDRIKACSAVADAGPAH